MIDVTNIRKVFILGDLHLGIRNNSLEWIEIQKQFLLDFFLNAVDEDGFDPDRDILLQLGDWHHIRESTNTRVYQASLEVASAFSNKFKRGVFIILGNHDVYYRDRTDVHSLAGFNQMYPNFHVFEKPEVVRFGHHNVLMLPWVEKTQDIVPIIRYHTGMPIFCHADFNGARLNTFTRLEHGVTSTDLVDVPRVYSGHIHIRQTLGNVTYVGTPYEMDRGDLGNTKGFYVVDFSKSDLPERFIENTVSPKHIKQNIMTILNSTIPELGQLFKNNFVDIQIESKFSSRFPLTQFTELVKDLGHRKLEFFSYSTEQTKEKSELELDSDYEYNIFTVLDTKLSEMKLAPELTSNISTKFKEIYDSLMTVKKYDQ